MSGAPNFTGRHAGRMGGHGPNAARGRHGEAHAAPGGFGLGGGSLGLPARPVASMRAGAAARAVPHFADIGKIEQKISSYSAHNVLIDTHNCSFSTIFTDTARSQPYHTTVSHRTTKSRIPAPCGIRQNERYPAFHAAGTAKGSRSPFDLPGALYYLQDMPPERQERQRGKGFLFTGSLSFSHNALRSIPVHMPDFSPRNHHHRQFPRFRDRPRFPPVKPPTKSPCSPTILGAPYAPERIPRTGYGGVNRDWRARVGHVGRVYHVRHKGRLPFRNWRGHRTRRRLFLCLP